MSAPNAKTVVAATEVILAVAECIRDLGEVPSGHLYAQLCGLMTLEQYSQIIEIIVSTGRVRESNHLLTWVGPV
jgi:hypothetical protein